MSQNTLYDHVWNAHVVGILPTGQTQIFVGRHLMHEVTSPQAFEMLRDRGLKIAHPELTTAVVDHVIPTDNLSRPFKDSLAEIMTAELEKNVKECAIEYCGAGNSQGVCHVTFPEQGIIWPGQLVVCGDSHTCTYGAFGALAFGIGTTQVSHVLATQTMAMDKLKVRRINVVGKLQKGVTAKDVALHIIRKLGVKGGVGFAYEFGGEVIDDMLMDERMTLCNLAVEGGARSGYVNPDQVTFNYLKETKKAPKEDFDKAVEYWKNVASGKDAVYDDVVEMDVSSLEPMVTWGVNPEQGITVKEKIPSLEEFGEKSKGEAVDALNYMGLNAEQELVGVPVDVVFIGSCTNGRLSDLIAAAEILKGKKVSVRTLIVPGSEKVKKEAEEKGLDKVFKEAGAEWRFSGCSMCLAMNPDKLIGTQRSASTSNRNFKGRQGSPIGRTHLMSPYTAAATALEGKISNPKKYLGDNA